VLEERGEVEVKGKGLMRTWYLVGRRDDDAVRASLEVSAEVSAEVSNVRTAMP
jgi:adenylate cyclase